MVDKSTDSSGEIEKLLEEKAQLEEWLLRLDLAGEKTSSNVREKVRADYQDRLDSVIAQLSEFQEVLEGSLEEQREKKEELAKRKSEAETRLSEAELRHTVGEFSDKQWESFKGKLERVLTEVGEKMAETSAEIERLEEVLAGVRGDEVEESGKSTSEPPSSEAVKGDQEEPEEEAEPAPNRPSGQGSPGLDVLRPASEDQETGPSPTRASGQMELSTELAEIEGDEEPVIEQQESKAQSARQTDEAGKNAKIKKTLKCSECGTMNLPTEWYCERCGAELAVL